MGGRIIKGEEAAPHSLPSIVRINIIEHKIPACKTAHCGLCGGTIVNEEWILTAGHCCVENESKTPKPPSAFTITTGAHYDVSCDYSGLCSPYTGVNGEEEGDPPKEVVEVVIHPQYTRAGVKLQLQWDACLLRINPFELEENFSQQARLPGMDYNNPSHNIIFIALLTLNETTFSTSICITNIGLKSYKKSPTHRTSIYRTRSTYRRSQLYCSRMGCN